MLAHDFKVEVFRTIDQGVNETGKGVRVFHLPTATMIQVTHFRTFEENRSVAISALLLVSEAADCLCEHGARHCAKHKAQRADPVHQEQE